MNSFARTPLRVRHEIRFRLCQVLHAETLTPRMRRIVLGGDALDGFVTAAADDHVKLFFPAPGQDGPVLPIAGPDGITWPNDALRPTVRDYTPRRWDPVARTLTLEFVLHGDGPAASWAANAAPGDHIGVGGPRGSLIPADHDLTLLIGDETALPAIARRLEEMSPGARAIALIEIADAAEERHLPTAANAGISWIHRDGEAPGGSALLLQALDALRLPAGDAHAWLAGEIEAMRTLRTRLVERHGIPRAAIRAAGYWRTGQADAHGRIED